MSQYRLMRHLVAVATLGAFATVGCFVVDDKDDDDEGGGGEAGETSGGSGGSATGGKGGTSTGGKGGTGSGSGAVMKFCNDLYRGGTEAAELTLTFDGVEATALSGTCTPVVPAACIPIGAVSGPNVSLTDPSDGSVVVDGSIPTLVVAAGEEILVLATVDEVEGTPTIQAGQFSEEFACADTDPYAMLEARSTPFRMPAQRNLRAQQNPAASRWMKNAVVAPGIGR